MTDAFCEAILAVKDPSCWVSSLPCESDFRVAVIAHHALDLGEDRDVADIFVPRGRSRDAIARIQGHPCVARTRFAEVTPGRLLGVIDTVNCIACRASETNGVMIVKAISREGGYLEWTVVSADRRQLKSLVDELKKNQCEVEVKRISALSGSTLAALDVTPRQREILAAAVRLGYFESPRRAKLADLGRVLGLSKQTVQALLRRAEKKILPRFV